MLPVYFGGGGLRVWSGPEMRGVLEILLRIEAIFDQVQGTGHSCYASDSRCAECIFSLFSRLFRLLAQRSCLAFGKTLSNEDMHLR